MKPNWKRLFLLTTCCTLGLMTSVRAQQVSPDGTLSTTVTSPDSLNFTINNGNRVGGNLFHSFREFSVPNGGSAVFQNPLDVQNIINRVTGGSLSQINGLIQSQGSANLFLLNPAGIFFGPNARLDIGGSFFATTADSLLFDNGFEFSATNPQAPPLLTVNIPVGLRFRDNPGNITNQAALSPQVPPGQTFALIGGDVNFDGGNLTALGVNVEIGGLKAPGTVGINNDRSLSFPDGVIRGDISFGNGASVDVSFIGGGSIAVNGRNVEVSGGSRLDAGIFPGFGMSEAQAGDIVINATDQVTITGTANFASVIANTVGSEATGNAGNIKFNTNNLSLSNAQINSSTSGNGNAGNVTISAGGAVSLENVSGIFSNLESTGKGNGGQVNIQAGSLSLKAGSVVGVSTFGQGNAGSAIIKVQNTLSADGVGSDGFSSGIFSNVQGDAVGNAGGIDITTGRLSLFNGAQIGSSTFNEGNAGIVKIQASDISFDGVGSNGFSSGIFSAVTDNAIGNAGSIDITTKTLSLTNGAVLSASTSGNGNASNVTINASDRVSFAGLGTNGFGSGVYNLVELGANGDAGNITINAASIFLDDRAVLRTTNASAGFAGNITLNARDQVSITNNSTISSDGNLGRIFIGSQLGRTDALSLIPNIINIDNSTLSTTNADPTGFAGNITLNARNQISITNNSTVSSEGNLGSIFIGQLDTTNALSVLPSRINIDNSTLNTTNSNTDFAGDITLNARDEIFIKDSAISSNGYFGQIFIGDANSFLPALVRIEGANTRLSTANNTAPNQDAGSINIAAGRVVMNLGEISSNTSGSSRAGDISVQATGLVEFVDNALFSNVETGAQNGQAGNITIKAGSFSLLNGAQLQSRVLGQGNGGNVTIDVPDGTVRIDGRRNQLGNQGNPSAIFNDVESGATGNAGNILINARNLFLTNSAQINSSISGIGNAGNISLQVGDAIALSDSSFIITNVQAGGSGIGGDIDIRGRSLTLTNASQIQAGLFREDSGLPGGNGTGGSIKINASDFVDISGFNPVSGLQSGIFTPAETGSTGPGGSIDITTGAFRLTNFGVVTARNDNGNNGGDITINAKTFEATNGRVQTTLSGQAEAGRLFTAGDIQLNVSDSVTLKDGSLINSSTSGIGNAGNISLKVGDAIALVNSSLIRSVVEQGGEGIGGDIDIRARSLTLTGGSQIQTALIAEGNGLSGGKGRAGNIEINATDFVNIFGVDTTGFSSGLFASAERGTTATSPQAAGNINLTTGNFRIADGAVVDALTSNSGDAGNITINANTFTANGGGQVITTTFNSGSAGNINLNIGDRITISGSDPNYNQRIEGTFDNQGAASGIFANTAPGSTGNGGSITIQPNENSLPRIAIADGGEVTVDSQGQGRGGEISITGNSLTLDRGIINASTQSSDGGNINLRLRNFLRLQNESLISANARGQQGGNGGNITINTPFIVAFPRNNDIIANAVGGDGGRVRTNATLFGIVPRTRADLERLGVPGLNPRNLPTSDITAFSEQNSFFGDNVLVTSPDVDPSRGLVELPETVTDPTQKIAQNPCQQGIGNEFFVTGRGGLPTTPNQTLNSDNVRVDLLQPVAISGNSRSATRKSATTVTATRLPAQGWIFNDKGQVVLTAYDPSNTGSQRPFSTAAACPAR
ncbi:filamentous hemagglutinin N-terminal domain-containing protein [Plectonema radiosum NIES-515]|uniref:Filamentous hemagglutinin N-terminal domain-containing protein n=1 Tax=Plectonema radiosum NIES-515 TaxID=2986073 RepID=A0ABT3AU67_9CYAN|nr:filamentous hemagglutinin N-terminal domain-containing protein [Plectonema radiosum]MCV3212669.1 filamentous hemagglutinin N-terminal domain-containing protein [Plectonema radiosum NIES-515]